MANQYEIGKCATRVFDDADGYTKVKYHDTFVVMFNNEKVILNTDGWKTATTKTRINQTANKYNLGLNVYQKNNVWYVRRNGEEIKFYDNMVIER